MATTMTMSHQGLENGDGLHLHLANLSLVNTHDHDNSKASDSHSNGSGSGGDGAVPATTSAAHNERRLDILDLARDITLSASNASFDPSASRRAEPPLQRANSSSAATGGVMGPRQRDAAPSEAPSVMREPPAFRPQQMRPHLQQNQQPPSSGEPEATKYRGHVYSGNGADGRVPATRLDGRKLFVGGLPSGVTDKSFLQFFQNYGEVIDSVVLVDRRTKRSRGFGFVTFADRNVAASLLNTIRGRTGKVNIMGKNCEVKASEPKTLNGNANHQQMTFGAGGSGGPVQALRVNPTVPIPPNMNYYAPVNRAKSPTLGGHRGGGEGVPVYSHSTVTRVAAKAASSIVSSAADGGSPANIYIQNNFYTLPPGTELPPSCVLSATLTPEALVQAQQRELTAALERTTAVGETSYTTMYSCSALQPLYPGRSGGEAINGLKRTPQRHAQRQPQPPKHQQRKARIPPYSSEC